MFVNNEIGQFFRISRLVSRHAVTLWYIIIYGVFAGRADYSADTHNANGDNDLWRFFCSDYSADMRKSIVHNGLC